MRFLKAAVCRNGRYLNPVPTEVGATKHLPTMFKKLLTNKAEATPKRQIGPFHTDVSLYRNAPVSGLRITLIGHSSLLIEMDGTTLLIDPVFSERASMVQWFGPKRFYPPPMRMEDLPPIDAVLLTHDHYDHLDRDALHKLEERKPRYVCSLGVEKHLARWGVGEGHIHPMNWMDEFTVPSNSSTPLTLTALPARHFSGRSFKRYGTLWSSFVLHTDRHHVYHGADSGYWEGFAEIGEHFGPFDLALLEIGAFDPLWSDIHLGPDNAMLAARDLRAKAVMPIHWGCFNLAFHAWYEPPERLTALAAEQNVSVFLPAPGVPAEFTGPPANSTWWRAYCTPEGLRQATGEGSSAASAIVHT